MSLLKAHAFSATFQKAGSPNSTIIFRIAQVIDVIAEIVDNSKRKYSERLINEQVLLSNGPF